MLKILQEISRRALLLNEYDFTEEQQRSKWLGSTSSSDEDIEIAKTSLQTSLPDDYVEFLKITNGFPQCVSTGVTFLPVHKVDYLINIDEDLVEIWNHHSEFDDTGQGLSESLVIGGLNEDQYLLLVPPNAKYKEWRYWKFASWIPGAEKFQNLKDYLESELKFLKQLTKGLRRAKRKNVVDYSLRDHVFNLDWKNSYNTAFRFLQEGNQPIYIGTQVDLLRLLLLSASKLNYFGKLQMDLALFRVSNNEHEWQNSVIARFEEAARNAMSHIADFQTNKFVTQEGSITLDKIEEQIRVCRPDLLKPKKTDAKADYQLYFLFEHGNASEFLRLYARHLDSPYFTSHLKAAIVYASLNKIPNAQEAIQRYYKTAFGYRSLDPFLDETLIEVMTLDFSKRMLLFD
jgi:SMI1 / KNR4 family (SUKH-1)